MRDGSIDHKYSGQRTSMAWKYILNLEDETEFSKLINAIENFLFQWELYTYDINRDEKINRLLMH